MRQSMEIHDDKNYRRLLRLRGYTDTRVMLFAIVLLSGTKRQLDVPGMFIITISHDN